MGIGSFTLACLLLAVGAGPAPDEIYLTQTRFKIPVNIEAGGQSDVSAIRLFCCRPGSSQWELAGTITKPNQDGFVFTADGDGTYLFKVAFVNRSGVQEPLDIISAPINQKIVIDTVKPQIRVQVNRQGDEIAVNWDVVDANPRLDSLRVDYHAADAQEGVWNAVAVPPGQNRITFKPNSAAAVTVRVQMEDMAGNLGTGQIVVPGAAGGPPIVQTTLPSPPPPAPPPAAPPLLANKDSSNNTAPPLYPPLVTRPADANPTIGQPSLVQPPRGLAPGLQIVNKSQVRLEYAVSKLGPSGVGSVEVFVTSDDGQTWERCPAEVAPALPVNDLRFGASATGAVLVQLPKDEVIYGFSLVVTSRAGLGKPAPKPGDPPQIRVERDTTPPLVKLNRPQPDPERRDALLLTWEASDRNLAANPITLEWAEDPRGPWQVIGKADLPNTGRFTWQVPSDIKPSVYLRLTARDVAGNSGVYQTAQPELVDLSVPEATITGVGGTMR
jgi:hypothetical protein